MSHKVKAYDLQMPCKVSLSLCVPLVQCMAALDTVDRCYVGVALCVAAAHLLSWWPRAALTAKPVAMRTSRARSFVPTCVQHVGQGTEAFEKQGAQSE